MAVNQQRSSQARLSRVLDHLAIERQGALDRLFQFLAIPSVSTDPAYHAACVTAAEWCANGLREIGFQARVENTPGKPMVVGHWHGSDSPSRVLFYGHYDVQPPDPWRSGPPRPSRRASRKILKRARSSLPAAPPTIRGR